jgi:hypothetical protein
MTSVWLIVFLVVVATTVWVAVDASHRDWRGDRFASGTWAWVLGCLLLWIIVFPIYLVRRGRVPMKGAGGASSVSVIPATSVADQGSARSPALFWWGIASALAMILGAFGPWVNVLAVSVAGTDGNNDGWIIVVLALIAVLSVLGQHRSRGLALLNVLLGLVGLGVTFYDRSNVSSAIEQGGTLAGALASVGWGLNLALAASASLTIQGVVATSRGGSRSQGATGSQTRATVATDHTAATSESTAAPVLTPTMAQPLTGATATGVAATAVEVAAQPTTPDASVGAAPAEELSGKPLPPPPPTDRPAPGWYADPYDIRRLRYWTGTEWSEEIAEIRPG